MGSGKNIYAKLNWTLIICYLLLIFFGWINIYASTYDEGAASMLSLSNRSGIQVLWMATSIISAFLILFTINPKIYPAIAWPTYLAVLCLLVAVLFFGKEINGSKSWLSFGGFAIQPSEFSKIATALCLSALMSRYGYRLLNTADLIRTLGIIAPPVLLIALEPDVGTILVYCGLAFVLYREGLPGWILAYSGLMILLFLLTLKFSPFVSILFTVGLTGIMRGITSRRPAGIITGYLLFIIAASFLPRIQAWKIFSGTIIGQADSESLLMILILPFFAYALYRGLKHKIRLFWKLSAGFLFAIAFIFSVEFIFDNVLKPHHRDRIENLLGISQDLQGAGYNVNQSRIAIGSGGFTGKGFLQGTQTKFNFVPEQSTDFIFCTIGEEWGFLGSVGVVLIFFIMILNLILTAERQKDKFTCILGYCIASYLFIHVFLNIGMTLGIMPVVGIPLPLVSYGGSSFLTFSILLFIYIRLDLERWR